jgi:segregation and condensation protein B
VFFQHLKGPLEALLFASGDPVPASKLAQILEVPEGHVESMIAEMQQTMTTDDRGLTIVTVAGGYQLCTKPQLAETVEKLAEIQDNRLSAAALETLAIIAFKQPITRQEMESIRGVKVDRVVHTLTERQLIKEIGRKDAIGRPILYGTTTEFLKCFGLKTLKDLPDLAGYLNVMEEQQVKQPE